MNLYKEAFISGFLGKINDNRGDILDAAIIASGRDEDFNEEGKKIKKKVRKAEVMDPESAMEDAILRKIRDESKAKRIQKYLYG